MSVTSPARPPVRSAGPPQRQSRLGYWIGAGLIAAAWIGCLVLALLAFFGYRDQVSSLQRMNVPGTAILHVANPAAQVLYYESAGPAPALRELGIHVTGPAGTAVEVTPYHGNLRYDVAPMNPTRIGKAIASFDAVARGDYRISALPAASTRGTIAIGTDLLWSASPYILGIITVFVAGTGAGLVPIIITAVRRTSARRRLSRLEK